MGGKCIMIVGDCGRLWGRIQQEAIIKGVEAKPSTLLEPPNYTSMEQRVLIFCTKHPKMRFTLECLLNDHEGDKLELDKEIEALVNDGILEKQISDVGTTWYYLR